MRIERRRNQGGTFIREEANGLYREQKGEGIRNNCIREEAKGLYREQKVEGIREGIYYREEAKVLKEGLY
jgi:hypothetical protein